MMSGDGNGDGQISYMDIFYVWNLQAGKSAYLESDYNMNGQVNNQDKNDFWVPNEGEGSYIPE